MKFFPYLLYNYYIIIEYEIRDLMKTLNSHNIQDNL